MIEPTTIEEIRDLYGVIDDSPLLLDENIESALMALKDVQSEIEKYQTEEKRLKDIISCYMKDKSTLINEDGEVLVTFKVAMPSESFNAKLFKAENKELYSKYVEIKPGTRRFLVK